MIWSGLRAGMARAISGMVLSELLLISVGIGTLFQTFQGEFNPEKTFGLVAILVAESLLILKVMALIERRSIPWFYTGRNN
jgi:NitT/TauT family transport system permease protein